MLRPSHPAMLFGTKTPLSKHHFAPEIPPSLPPTPPQADAHTCTELCPFSARRPFASRPLSGEMVTRRRVLASQTSLPVHNTFPAIHNLIYVTIAPINNSVGQLRNYSLKGPAHLLLPPAQVSLLHAAPCPENHSPPCTWCCSAGHNGVPAPRIP